MRFLSAKWKALLDGPGNHCASGGSDVRSCLSTTSLNSSSNIMSSKPSLFFASRQREGEFFKQGCGEKGTTSLSPCSGPSGTNVPLSLFQAQMLNDPECAKNVKGLESMLLVRESACLGLAGSDYSGSRVVAGCESHAVGTVSESQRGAVWLSLASGCDNTSEDVVLESGGRENDAAITVSALQRGALWSPRASGGANSDEDAVLETFGRENDAVFTVSKSSPSVKAGENGESGLLEVIESDFSSPLTDYSLEFISCVIECWMHEPCFAFCSCLCTCCLHARFCSAPAAVVPLCMHVGDTCACINSWSDTGRVQGPTGRGVPKVGFPVRPKICVLSQRWRQG